MLRMGLGLDIGSKPLLQPRDATDIGPEPWGLTVAGTKYWDGAFNLIDPAPGGKRVFAFSDSQTSDSDDFAYVYTTYYAYGNSMTFVDLGVAMTLDPLTTLGDVLEVAIGAGYNPVSGFYDQVVGPLFDATVTPNLQYLEQWGTLTGSLPTTWSGWPSTLKAVDVSNRTGVASSLSVSLASLANLKTAPFAAVFEDFKLHAHQLATDISSLQFHDNLGVFHYYGNASTGDLPRCTYARNTPPAANFGQFYFGNYAVGGAPGDSGFAAGPCDDLSGVTGTDTLAYSCTGTNRTGFCTIMHTPSIALSYSAAHNPGITGMTGIYSNVQEAYFYGCSFNAAAVNAALAEAVANPYTGAGGEAIRKLDFSGTGMAAPTGQGLTDKATLIGRGNTVLTN